MADVDCLRAPLVAALDRARTHLTVEKYGDPHVAFLVLVYPDAEPTIVAVTPKGPHDLRTIVEGEAVEADRDGGRFFTPEELDEAAQAMDDARFAMRLFRLRSLSDPALRLGDAVAEEVLTKWESRRARPILEALARAEEEARRPALCEGCGRRFTERGIAAHLSRSRRCPAARGL